MATKVCVLDGGGPKDSENTPNSFLTKCGEKVFWQIGADMLPVIWKKKEEWGKFSVNKQWALVE